MAFFIEGAYQHTRRKKDVLLMSIGGFFPSKGVVLAAGLGSRLGPMTQSTPKPLLPFMGIPILHLILWRLKKIGLTDIAVNTHYLSQALKENLQIIAQKDLPVPYLNHEPKILGTLGVYDGLRNWIDKKDILSINGDIISPSPLEELIKAHEEMGRPLATLMVLDRPHQNGKQIWLDREQKVLALDELNSHHFSQNSTARPFGFACAQIISSVLLEKIPKNTSSEMAKTYEALIHKGFAFGAHIQKNFWFDVGSPKDYFDAHLFCLKNKALVDQILWDKDLFAKYPDLFHVKSEHTCDFFKGLQKGPCLLHGASIIAPRSQIGPFVVMNGPCRIESDSIIEKTILLEGASIPRGSVIKNKIIGKDFVINLND